jgi:CheY-like chemotaxis protein
VNWLEKTVAQSVSSIGQRAQPALKKNMVESLPNVFRVLAIDDDEDDQMIFARWARRAVNAPEVKLINDAVSAINYLETLGPASTELPHVILCDIKMPGVDGFEFLNWLRSSPYKQIPIVMRSSSPLHSDIAKAYQLGANSYVVKRIGLDAMEQRIEQLMHYWRNVAEVPGR